MPMNAQRILTRLTSRRAVTIAIVVIAALYTLVSLAKWFGDVDSYHWDFHAYYYATLAHSLGLDPYDADDVLKVAPESLKVPFVYPPHVLLIFRPLLTLEYSSACRLMLALKLVACCWLAYLWVTYFLRDERDILLFPVMVFAFGGTLLADMRMGNVSIFEQALLWTGLSCYVHRRWGLYCLLIVMASLLKFVPAFFLGLLFFADAPRLKRLTLLTASAGSIGLVLVLNYLFLPSKFASFVANASVLDHRSRDNPCLLALLRDTTDSILGSSRGSPDIIAWSAFIAVATAVLLISLLAYVSMSQVEMKGSARRRILVMLATITYVLVAPRLMIYSYIVAIPATFYVLKNAISVDKFLLLLLFIVLLPRLMVNFNWWIYSPMIMSGCVWALLVHQLVRPARTLARRDV